MKKFPLMLVGGCLFLLSFTAHAANLPTNFPFQVGERLTYQIYWGPFVGGHATLEVAGIETVDGHDCFHLVASAQTSGLADFLFHVTNKTESWLDAASLQTRRFREERQEGKHRRADESHYDYASNQIITSNFVTGKIKSAILTNAVQDPVSCFYYVRIQPLQLDVESKLPLDVAGQHYDVTMRPDERKSLYVRPLGDVQALRIEPTPTLSFVAANNGRMWFWVSDDEHKYPLLLSSDMKIGSAKLVLTDIKKGKPAAPVKAAAAASTNSPPPAATVAEP